MKCFFAFERSVLKTVRVGCCTCSRANHHCQCCKNGCESSGTSCFPVPTLRNLGLALVAMAATLPAGVAYAGCSSSLSGGTTTVTCTNPPVVNSPNIIIGGPAINAPPSNPQTPGSYALPSNYNVTVSTDLSAANSSVISLMSNNNITIGPGVTFQTTASGDTITGGGFGTGPNAIDVGASSNIIIQSDATVSATGGNRMPKRSIFMASAIRLPITGRYSPITVRQFSFRTC